MAITVKKPEGVKAMPPKGTYTFVDEGGGWSYVISGNYGVCKNKAINAYKRDRGSNFGTISVTHKD